MIVFEFHENLIGYDVIMFSLKNCSYAICYFHIVSVKILKGISIRKIVKGIQNLTLIRTEQIKIYDDDHFLKIFFICYVNVKKTT